MSARSRSLLFEIGWHAAFIVILLWLLPVVLFGGPFWSVAGLNKQLVEGFAATYFAAATIYLTLISRSDSHRILTALFVAAGALAIVYFWVLLLPNPSYSRALIVAGTALVAVGLLAQSFVPAVRRFPVGSATLAVLVGVLLIAAGRNREPTAGFFATLGQRLSGGSAKQARSKRSVLVPASGYTLSATYYSGYFARDNAPAPPFGGAVTPDPSGHGYLLVRARGELYRLNFDSAGELDVDAIGLRVPINNAEFEADVPKVGIATGNFRVAGVLALPNKDGTRIFVSHHFWKRKEKCFVVRVSSLIIPRQGKLPAAASHEWQTIYETQPCLPLKHARGVPFAGLQVGGRLVALGENRLLLSVGDHQFDGWYGTPDYVEDPRAPYGKTILLDLAKGTASIFTSGHRNEQGLHVDATGRIWETEHGPQGGDELNLLRQGQNYGWPNHTYGTEYGSVTWPLNEQHHGPANYVRPVYAWVPSIGISDLVDVQDSAFERWRNDLLIASLRAKELWRVRVEEGRVVYAEPIPIGERIRDITTAGRGEFILWTDQETIVRLTPARGLDKAAETFVLNCGSCHGMGEGNAVGPTLGGVVGRSVASVPGYEYSNALRRLGGKWTAERLNSFLTRPDSLVPGTAMRFDGVSDPATRSAIIAYLRSYNASAQ
jgi:cytochrome c2